MKTDARSSHSHFLNVILYLCQVELFWRKIAVSDCVPFILYVNLQTCTRCGRDDHTMTVTSVACIKFYEA